MTDVQIAKNNLPGHTICLCKDGKCLFGEKHGIAPMMSFIEEGIDLTGYSVADSVVGKAAAMLFVKCGIKEVYAGVLSRDGKRFLEDSNIPFFFEILSERIINRSGTDSCPMEKAVKNAEDAEDGYILLKNQIKLMEKQKRELGL